VNLAAGDKKLVMR